VIGSIDLTYSRYHRSADHPQTERPDREPGPARPSGPVWGAETPDGDREMAEITDRLNRKAHAAGGEIAFRMETKARRAAQIVMVHGPQQTELGRYGSADIIDLERSLFDMAGFRFSIEG